MSLDKTLVGGASGILVLLGGYASQVFPSKSPQCLQAIREQAVNIASVCPTLTNGELFGMILLGGVAFVAITFGREILQSLFGERERT